VGQAGTGSSGDGSRRRHTKAANGRVESASATGASLAGDHPDHPIQDSQWQIADRRYLSETSMALLMATDHPGPVTTTGDQEVVQLTTS
jgi:hypothetical protein